MENRKKILIVAESLGVGGVEKSLINWLDVISLDNSFEVDFVLFRNDINYKNDKLNFIKMPNFIKNKTMPIKTNLKKLNIFVLFYDILKSLPLRIKTKCSYGDAIRYYYTNKLNKIEKEYDVCIAYTDGLPLFYSLNKVNYKRLITFVHRDISLCDYKKSFFRKYDYVDNIVCVSEKAMNSFLLKAPYLKNKTQVINNLIDYKKIKKSILIKEKLFNKKYINIISVGRLTEDKNYEFLIKTYIASANKSNKKSRLYIIGDGYEMKKLKKIILNYKRDDIFLLGAKKNPYKYINDCDIYVQPSKSEGFCLTIFEAAFLKKPILTTNVGAASDIIKHEYNGYISYDYKNDFELLLSNLINSEKKRKTFSKNINCDLVFLNSNSIEKFLNLLKGE